MKSMELSKNLLAKITNEEAKERMASLGILSAGVAHEINNPIGYAIVNLDLLSARLEKMPLDPETKHEIKGFVEEAKRGTSRVRDIVQSLKVFSHREEGKISPVDLNSILESAIKLTSHEISLRATLVTDFSPEIFALGIESKLGQVFINLLINAVHAIPEGQQQKNTITVRTGRTLDSEPFAEISDSGVGMSSETKSKIFNPFFTTKSIGVGTGLGLSICHGIIKSLGGTISVESEIGQGTSIKIVLQKTAPPSASVQRQYDQIQINKQERRLKILIVDDEIAFANLLKKTIDQDHEATTESSSPKALEAIKQNLELDFIICDLMMPEMTGMEIYQKLKEDGRGLEEKLIFMSGGAFTPQTISFYESITNPRLEKPFSIAEFRKLIGTLSVIKFAEPTSC